MVRDAQGQVRILQPSLAEWLKVDREKVRALLNALAYQAHAAQPELVGTADVPEGELVSGLLHLSQNPDAKPGRLVEYLSQRAGLLLPRGMAVYTFPHRTFQEYLAACHLTDTDYPDLVADLARQDPNRWREVALLAGAKAARGTASAVWALADALCYRQTEDNECGRGDVWGGLLAAQALVETANLAQVSERNRARLELARCWLKQILDTGDLPAVERVHAGNLLAHLGDDRPGVALRSDGLPDIAWQEIPAGPFVMGSDKKKDKVAYGDEQPQHQPDLPAFRISRYPVTNVQYGTFVKDGGYTNKWRSCWTEAGWKWKEDRTAPDTYGGNFDLANHPVVMVTWYEAMAFCNWLTTRLRETGELNPAEIITLPSEAKWEKAARGTDGRIYPWGDKADPNKANYYDTGIGATSAAGCFPGGMSVYGCLDMSGNVDEWTRSIRKGYPYSSKDGREDLEGEAARVVRGGAFINSNLYVRCAVRDGNDPSYRGRARGFRVCCVVSPFTSEL
jgi:formylglycine-generating enzyme required for sulfatase activity